MQTQEPKALPSAMHTEAPAQPVTPTHARDSPGWQVRLGVGGLHAPTRVANTRHLTAAADAEPFKAPTVPMKRPLTSANSRAPL